MACNGSGIPPLHSHLAKSSVTEARVNIDENLGDVVLRHRGDFIVRWSNMIKHITVFKEEECNADVMSCAYHLSVEFKNPSAIVMLLCT